MPHKYCRVGQRLFTQYVNMQGKLRGLAKSKNPNLNSLKKAKEESVESKNDYNDHCDECDICTPY